MRSRIAPQAGMASSWNSVGSCCSRLSQYSFCTRGSVLMVLWFIKINPWMSSMTSWFLPIHVDGRDVNSDAGGRHVGGRFERVRGEAPVVWALHLLAPALAAPRRWTPRRRTARRALLGATQWQSVVPPFTQPARRYRARSRAPSLSVSWVTAAADACLVTRAAVHRTLCAHAQPVRRVHCATWLGISDSVACVRAAESCAR